MQVSEGIKKISANAEDKLGYPPSLTLEGEQLKAARTLTDNISQIETDFLNVLSLKASEIQLDEQESLADELYTHDKKSATLHKEITKSSLKYRKSVTEPDRIFSYSFCDETNVLYWTNLKTGVNEFQKINHTFLQWCCLCEIPGNSLIITGGGVGPSNTVVRIDLNRDFAVTAKQPMVKPRWSHNSTYYNGHVYAIGGYNVINDCERYECLNDLWEEIPPLPTAVSTMAMVVLESTLYVLGGYITIGNTDIVQELNLETLIWKSGRLMLPLPTIALTCFNFKDELYFVIESSLYKFTALGEQKLVKELSANIECYLGPSYFSNGTIYSSYSVGPANKLNIGNLV